MTDSYDRRIIELLKREGPVKARILAQKLNVSERSIRNYISRINASKMLIGAGQDGYFLANSIDDDFDLDETLSARQRQNAITFNLLKDHKGISCYNLEERYSISEATLMKDISIIKERIAEHDLNVFRRKGFLYLEGDEKDQRACIRSIVMNDFNTAELLSETVFSSEYDIKEEDIRNIINSALNANELFINDYALANLTMHICITVERLLQNDLLTSDSIGDIDSFPIEQKAAADIASELSKKYHITFNKNEIDQIAFLLINKTSRIDFDSDDETKIIDAVGNEYYELAKKLSQRVDRKFALDTDDEIFILKLALHLKNVSFRANNDHTEINPLREKLKVAYPFIYEIAVYFADGFTKATDLSLNEDEIAYIAMHYGTYLEERNALSHKISAILVCRKYYDSSKILLNKLQTRFCDDMEIVKVISDPSNIKTEDCDLIISVYPVSHGNSEYVEINPFPNENDMLKIATAIASIRKKNNILLKEEIYRQFFDEKLFSINDEFASPEDAIIKLSQKLISEGYADNSFTAAVLERENKAPTSFDIHVAVPHSIEVHTTKNISCVSICRKPMRWGFCDVSLIILIGTADNEEESFQKLYTDILDVLQNEEMLLKILNCSSCQEFISVFAGS